MRRLRRAVPAVHVWVRTAFALLAAGTISATLPASAQMPDLREMSGRPLPSGDLPAGTVTVRVIRQTMGNNVPDVEVTLRSEGSDEVKAARTDAEGRATFVDVAPGRMYRAEAVVDGERLSSQEFPIPAAGGVRLMLVAGLGTAASGQAQVSAEQPAARPVQPGALTLSGESRVVVELADELVEVFSLVEIVNGSGAPVSLPQPIVFDLPAGALGAAVLDESASVAKLEGQRVIVSGPLAAGTTGVQFAYRLPSDAGRVQVRQAFPLAAPRGTVIVRKLGDLEVNVAGERARREVPLQGRTYIVVTTGGLNPGTPVDITVTGLPARARWPLYLTFGLAGLSVLAGAGWATAGRDVERSVDRLRSERASRFGELLQVERKLRGKAAGDAALIARKEALITEIAELDATIAERAAVRRGPDEAERLRREQTSTAS